MADEYVPRLPGPLDSGRHMIQNHPVPVLSDDVATKGYVDTAVTGATSGASSITFGPPSVTFSSIASSGVSTSTTRSDATFAVFDTTNPSTQAFGDAAQIGTALFAARRDHKHAMPAAGMGGDLTGNFPSPTLSGIGSAIGPVGGASVVPVITIDTKGRVTALTSVAASSAVTSVSAADSSVVVTPTTGAVTVAAGTLDVIARLHAPATSWSNSSQLIRNLADPTVAQDAATKNYVDVGIGGASWIVVTKTADTSIASSTTVTNDPHLSFTASNGVLYAFEIDLDYSSATGGGTPDLKIAFGEDNNLHGSAMTIGLNTADSSVVSAGNTALSNQPTYGTAATKRTVQVRGWHAGVGTTFRLQWAQATSSTSATSCFTGSILRYRVI